MAIDVSHHDPSGPPGSNIAFYYDFGSPESYLALERFAKQMAAFAPELVPVVEADLDPLPMPDAEARREAVEELAQRESVLPLVWPEDFPFLDTSSAVRVATYAKSIGKVAVFSLSLFRQVFAAGRDPADIETLYLAGVAAEIHPRAVDQALTRDRVLEQTELAGEQARATGVTSVPTLRMGRRTLVGPAIMQDAYGVLRDALEAYDDA